MRLGPKILAILSLVLAAFGCWLAASVAANVIERRSAEEVRVALVAEGHDWAEVHADGLQVHIGGLAPTEAQRFKAIHVAGTVVDPTRVIDGSTVAPTDPLAPPPYSIEILRNDEGVTLIGLVPESLDRAAMVGEITALAQGAEVIDLLETARYPARPAWDEAVNFGLNALALFTRAKISIAAGAVTVDAISSSEEERRDLEKRLTRRVPESVELSYDISAPRPVITPFTLRFLIDENGARFDACSVASTRGRGQDTVAPEAAGLKGPAECTLGLGVPSPDWPTAVVQAIEALAQLGGGSLTFSDADVTLIARATTSQAAFDRVVGELESNLPEVFSLHSVLPEPADADGGDEAAGPPEFVATLSPEGQVQLRGRLNNAMVRETVGSFAKARFGVDAVHMAARIDDQLPPEWTVRVLTGLQALAELDNGAAVVQEEFVEIRGTTGNPDGRAEVARILAEKLGEAQDYRIDVSYDEALDPVAALPSPEECIGQVNALLAGSKITFEPGSAEISGPGIRVVNEIADILKACREVEMRIEIAGHTDSQGREEMNLELSQQRSDSVLEALMARRVLVSRITAVGYGEAEPIAENDTEEGREANRRIEFRLLREPDAEEAEDTAPAEGDPPSTDEETATEATPDDAGSGDEGPEDTGSGDAGPEDATEDSQ